MLYVIKIILNTISKKNCKREKGNTLPEVGLGKGGCDKFPTSNAIRAKQPHLATRASGKRTMLLC